MSPRLMPTLSLLAAAIASVPAADTYQFELTLGYAASESDQSEDERSRIHVDGAYFVEAVTIGEAPNEEADFLGHHSYIAGYSTTPWQSSGRRLISQDTVESGAIDADGLSYGVSGQYAAADVAVTAGAGILVGSIEDDAVDIEFEPLDWTANVGYWAMPNAIVGVRYTKEKLETTIGSASSDIETVTIELFGKGVHQFANDQAINVEASAGQQTDDDGDVEQESWVGNLVVDWYPDPRYGLGIEAGGLRGDNDAEEGFTFGLRGSAWFTTNLGLRAGIRQFVVDDSDLGEDVTSWYVELAGRF